VIARAVVWSLLAAFTAACGRAETEDSAARVPATSARRTEITLSPAQQAEAMIETAPVTLTEQPDLLRVSGRIALPDTRTWHVGVRTDGLVSSVVVGAGDLVRKGQILARYHADELRDARAKYAQALTDLQRARSAEGLAQRYANRAETLLDLKAASLQQAEQARQDLLNAQAATAVAEIEVKRVRHVLEHDLQVSADLDQDDEAADEVPIFSPAAGFVLERNISPGRAVHTNDDAFVIGDLSQVWMLASVRQEQLGLLRVGDEATVVIAGPRDQRFRGRLTNLGQQLDPATRVMQVRIVVNNPENRLRPEMLATAEIPVGMSRPLLLVPSGAVQQIDNGDVVFVRSAPDRFAVRPVRLGEVTEGSVEVAEGLKAGEQVVVNGSFVLKSQLLRAAIEEE
jgi:cobalt-zinc-cadmium efflux system membrane fusion protein